MNLSIVQLGHVRKMSHSNSILEAHLSKYNFTDHEKQPELVLFVPSLGNDFSNFWFQSQRLFVRVSFKAFFVASLDSVNKALTKSQTENLSRKS